LCSYMYIVCVLHWSWWQPAWHDYHFLNRISYKSHLVPVSVQRALSDYHPNQLSRGRVSRPIPSKPRYHLAMLACHHSSHYLLLLLPRTFFQLTVSPRPLAACFSGGVKMRPYYSRTFVSTPRRARASVFQDENTINADCWIYRWPRQQRQCVLG
jgi:hypothetical protein